MRVLIIPDKFKGTLTAREAAEAIAAGWDSVRPGDTLELLPMSDGGDGFGEIIGEMMGGRRQRVATVDSAHRPRIASFWFNSTTRTAVIESAEVNGLALLPPGKYHPFELDTFGLGAVFDAAFALGADHFIVGIGGSATNDGGFGMARALGWKFFTKDDRQIDKWTDLDQLARVSPVAQNAAITVACDVQNPLLGPSGASRIYGPQKGLRPEDMQKAEACLARLAEVIGHGFEKEPGTGAAGGLGYGLRAFCNGEFVSGAKIFSDAARLDERLPGADLVISGEGAIDEQTLMGKGVGFLFQRCREAGVRCLALAGGIGPNVESKLDKNLRVMGIVPQMATLEQAKSEPARWLTELAVKAARECEIA